jgi:hypothetical protein
MTEVVKCLPSKYKALVQYYQKKPKTSRWRSQPVAHRGTVDVHFSGIQSGIEELP